ncbi:hypothetical protein [Streptomyces sp. NPDC040750]|uniref:hypothetical protein n=1 Tax=Streptomyces sp. NPDC040750 TaxID=3154491 RepID=UPI003403189A
MNLTVPGCVGRLHLDGGGSPNWATAEVQSTGPNTCWLAFWQRNTVSGGKTSQGVKVDPYSSGGAGSAYYHDSTHQVAISISNGVQEAGSNWYN